MTGSSTVDNAVSSLGAAVAAALIVSSGTSIPPKTCSSKTSKSSPESSDSSSTSSVSFRPPLPSLSTFFSSPSFVSPPSSAVANVAVVSSVCSTLSTSIESESVCDTIKRSYSSCAAKAALRIVSYSFSIPNTAALTVPDSPTTALDDSCCGIMRKPGSKPACCKQDWARSTSVGSNASPTPWRCSIIATFRAAPMSRCA